MERPEIQAWMPGASLETLKQRAGLLESIRAFFKDRGVLEVDTPILSHAGNTDPHLESFSTHYQGPGRNPDNRLFLHTSPEFAMKRMLAAGFGDIYQVCKVFRNGERGHRHNPEFSMLEWYRSGMDHHALMDEVAELIEYLGLVGTRSDIRRFSYGDLFLEIAGIDPHSVDIATLHACARDHELVIPESMATASPDIRDRDVWLDLLLTQLIEPAIRQRGFLLVYDYPASQAALAKIRYDDKVPVAERFELYAYGVELANGFHELSDASEQERRFDKDLELRKQNGLNSIPVDHNLLEALLSGLPDCAGVAIGLDRLVMLITGERDIQKVLAFDIDRA